MWTMCFFVLFSDKKPFRNNNKYYGYHVVTSCGYMMVIIWLSYCYPSVVRANHMFFSVHDSILNLQYAYVHYVIPWLHCNQMIVIYSPRGNISVISLMSLSVQIPFRFKWKQHCYISVIVSLFQICLLCALGTFFKKKKKNMRYQLILLCKH